MTYRLNLDADERDGRGLAERPPGRRYLVRTVAAGLVVRGAAGAWAGYRLGGHGGAGGAVPVIHADPRPTKVKPDQPGGMVVPDQDKYVLNREKLVDSKVEQLLPPPEAPLPRPVAPPEPPAAAPVEPLTGAPAVESLPPAAAPTAVAPAVPPPAAVAPKPAEPPKAAGSPKPAEPPKAKAASAPATAPHPPAAPGGSYRLQIGALRSPEAAKAEWTRLQHQNHDLLGGLGYSAVRADLGEKGVFYRIQAGPIADLGAAERTCKELRQRHLGCMLVKP
jgi:cell division septation protein DedD